MDWLSPITTVMPRSSLISDYLLIQPKLTASLVDNLHQLLKPLLQSTCCDIVLVCSVSLRLKVGLLRRRQGTGASL
ncbi:hypothetical protein O9993_09710 [Vibrio lentus]|nr:hypothetical protein [Vibrio lentus]